MSLLPLYGNMGFFWVLGRKYCTEYNENLGIRRIIPDFLQVP
jgi:hypothetical protein